MLTGKQIHQMVSMEVCVSSILCYHRKLAWVKGWPHKNTTCWVKPIATLLGNSHPEPLLISLWFDAINLSSSQLSCVFYLLYSSEPGFSKSMTRAWLKSFRRCFDWYVLYNWHYTVGLTIPIPLIASLVQRMLYNNWVRRIQMVDPMDIDIAGPDSPRGIKRKADVLSVVTAPRRIKASCSLHIKFTSPNTSRPLIQTLSTRLPPEKSL